MEPQRVASLILKKIGAVLITTRIYYLRMNGFDPFRPYNSREETEWFMR
jgi:hypothetical protein